MNKKRFFCLVAFVCLLGLSYSCDKETADESEDFISIDRKDTKEQDT